MSHPYVTMTLTEILALAKLCRWNHWDDVRLSRVRSDQIGVAGYFYRYSQRLIANNLKDIALTIQCRVPFKITDIHRISETLDIDWERVRWHISRDAVDIKPSPESPKSVTAKRIGAELPSVFSDIDVDGMIDSMALDEAWLDPNTRLRGLVRQSGLSRQRVADFLDVSLETIHNWMAPSDNRRFRKCPDWALRHLSVFLES